MTTWRWWAERSVHAKAVALLAALLILQFGLCAAIPDAPGFPAVRAVLLVAFIATFALLMLAFASWLIRALLS
jgi:hypothetical protein